MNMAPYSSGLRLSALVPVGCYAILFSYTVLTPPSSAAEAIDKLIYREEFPAADKAAAWHVAYSGTKAPSVTIATEPGAAGGDAVAAKDGYLSIQPGEAGQTILLWTEVKQWEVPEWSIPQFRWRQHFEKVATGSGNKPAMAHSLKPALRIGRAWHEALLGHDPPKEPGGKWEEASRWIDGELRWQQWKLDGDKLTPGKTVRWGGVERVALPNEAVTAFGLLFKIEAPVRIGAFSIRVWRPQSPDVPPDAKGAWPQFKRNAQRTGDALDEDLQLPLRRIGGAKLPCPIYASPAVLEGVAIVQDAGGHVVCYDHRQRKIMWLAKLEGVANHSSPAIRDGKVYIGSCAGYLAILDATNGRLLKEVPAEGGVITAPAITPNGIYFTTFNGKLVKIDAEGNVIWTFGMGERSIVEFAVRGDDIAVCGGTQDHALFHVLDEGRSARHLNRIGLWQAHCGPVYGPHGRVALSGYMSEGSERYLYAFSRNHWVSVRHYGFPEWNSGDIDGQNNTRAVPTIANDRLYHGDICYDLNGREIWRTDWKASCIFGGGYQLSPAVTKNHVVIGGEDGKLYFFRSDPKLKSGEANKPEWSFTSEGAGKPNGAISSSPAVADGKVFVGDEDGVLYVLGQGEERPVSTAQIEAPLPQPAVARVNNLEWPTIGGDMGYSWVSPDTTIKPPLKVKWKTRIWSTTKGPIIVAAGLVFTANRLGEVHALDADTGRIVWRYSHLGPESIPSPTYAEGKLLIFRCASQYVPRKESLGLWCHDAKTGNVLWHKPLVFAYHHPSDGLVAVNQKVFIPVLREGKLSIAALSLQTGDPVWEKTYDDLLYPDFGQWMRFSIAAGDGRVFLSVTKGHDLWQYGTGYPRQTGATLAVDPETGGLLWQNKQYSIDHQTRMMYRKGIVVVFDTKGGHALDASSGKRLWDGPGMNLKAYQGCYFFQPLSDAFLESKGRRGVVHSDGCEYPVFINGLWYGHIRAQGHATVAREEVAAPDADGITVSKEIWRHPFLGRACPSPAPAYGRLYFSPNSEGVVYCFENTTQEQSGAKSP